MKVFFALLGASLCCVHPAATQGCNLIVEKGQSFNLYCRVRGNATSVSWQLYKDSEFIDLEQCTLVNKTCSYTNPSAYTGSVVNIGNVYTVFLNIISVRTNETAFRCITNTGASIICHLEVYAWPTAPICNIAIVNCTVTIICTTSNVYTGIKTNLRYYGMTLAASDLVENRCIIFENATGSLDTYSAQCTWRIPVEKFPTNRVYFWVQMTPFVSNLSQLHRPPVRSNIVSVIVEEC